MLFGRHLTSGSVPCLSPDFFKKVLDFFVVLLYTRGMENNATMTVELPKELVWRLANYLQNVVDYQRKEFCMSNPHWKKVVDLMKKQDKEFARCFNGVRRAQGGEELMTAWSEAEKCGFVSKAR